MSDREYARLLNGIKELCSHQSLSSLVIDDMLNRVDIFTNRKLEALRNLASVEPEEYWSGAY